MRLATVVVGANLHSKVLAASHYLFCHSHVPIALLTRVEPSSLLLGLLTRDPVEEVDLPEEPLGALALTASIMVPPW